MIFSRDSWFPGRGPFKGAPNFLAVPSSVFLWALALGPCWILVRSVLWPPFCTWCIMGIPGFEIRSGPMVRTVDLRVPFKEPEGDIGPHKGYTEGY